MKINEQYIYLSGNLRMALIYIRNCNREMEVVTMGTPRLDKIRSGGGTKSNYLVMNYGVGGEKAGFETEL